MNRILSILALLVLAAAPQRLAADPADIAAAARSVVRIVLISEKGDSVTMVGHGSGIAVAPDLVLTNAHVVAPLARDSSLRIGVVPSQGETGWFAKVAAYSPHNDLALVRLVERGNLVPAALYTGAVTDGEDVYAVGYPGNVDAAQGLSAVDLMSPTAPVKTHGSVSSGRSNLTFDTILHTAPIGAGNSGGPLLDGCGRVIGANSFGTESASSADSAFYFAISMREIGRFLIQSGVKPQTTGEPCRSLSDFQNAEQARLAGQQAAADEQARAETARHDAALVKAREEATMAVFSAREDRMGLAGVALLLAALAGGAALVMKRQNRPGLRKLAIIGATLLVITALIVWFTRPSLGDIDSRVAEITADALPTAAASLPAAPAEGAMLCVIDSARSRVTVSPTTDVPLNWRTDGCVNERSQYGLGADGWSRILAPGTEDTVSIASYDPATRTYQTDRFLLDAATMAQVRKARSGYSAPACGSGEAAARSLGESQAAIRALLPLAPNERLVYSCSRAP